MLALNPGSMKQLLHCEHGRGTFICHIPPLVKVTQSKIQMVNQSFMWVVLAEMSSYPKEDSKIQNSCSICPQELCWDQIGKVLSASSV